MNLPIPKQPMGSHPLAAWMRDVVKCLEMLQPRAGVGTKTLVTPQGTIITAKPQRQTTTTTGGQARYA